MTAVRSLVRPSVPAAASLLVNGLLLAVLLTMGAARQDRSLDDHPLSVLSLAALKGSEDGEERALTAEPAASAPAKQAVVQPPAPPTPAVLSAVVAPPLPPLSSPLSMPSAPASASASASSTAVATSPAMSLSSSVSSAPSSRQGAAPPRRGIAEGLDADAPAGKSMAYAARVRSWLYAHKIYPRRARMRREEGVVRVRFVIDRMGVLIEGSVIGSSGRSSLDEEAKAMMHRASPFPSAPAVITGDRIEFTAPIEFILPV